MRFIGLVVASALLFPGPSLAAESPKLTDGERAAVLLAEKRGALLYSYDQAAWHGTDDLLSKVDRRTFRPGGWIVDGPVDAPELVFFDTDAANPHAVYIADFRDGKLVASRLITSGANAELSPQRKRMIDARSKATAAFVAQNVGLCSKERPNTVVLPPETPDGPILVYLLTPQPDMNTFSFGGHYRVGIGPDGKAGPVHAFARSCITASTHDARGDPTAALFITHLLDPTPTEIHVFTALTAHVPLMVGPTSNNYLWSVTGNHIAAVNLATGT